MSNVNQPRSQSSRKKVLIFTVGGLCLLLLVLVGAWFFVSTKFEIVDKGSTQPALGYQIVCDSKIINRFNAASDTSNSDYSVSLKNLGESVLVLPNHDEDPNCSFILYNFYLYNKNIGEAKKYADQLMSFDNKGVYISGKFSGSNSIQNVQDNLNSLENGGSTNTGDSG